MQIHRLNLGLKSQTLMRSGATPGDWNELSLEEVRDEVRGQARAERAEDRTVRLSDCRIEFESDGRACIRYRGSSRFGRPQPITTDALLQIGRMVTRPSAFTLFEDLVHQRADETPPAVFGLGRDPLDDPGVVRSVV